MFCDCEIGWPRIYCTECLYERCLRRGISYSNCEHWNFAVLPCRDASPTRTPNGQNLPGWSRLQLCRLRQQGRVCLAEFSSLRLDERSWRIGCSFGDFCDHTQSPT